MTTIARIRAKLRNEEYEFTIPHFLEEMADENLIFEDVRSAILSGTVRRRFTRDPRGTRYEIVGEALDGRKVAVVCRMKTTGRILLITT